MLGLLVALLLPQVALRGTARAAARGPGEGFAMPESRTSDEQLETMVSYLARRNRGAVGDIVASSGAGVDLPTAWALLGVHMRSRLLGQATRQSDVEDRLRVPHGVLTSFYDGVVAQDMLRRDGDQLSLTEQGRAAVTTLGEAWASWLLDQLADADSDRAVLDTRIRAAVGRIARRMMLEQQPDLAPTPVAVRAT